MSPLNIEVCLGDVSWLCEVDHKLTYGLLSSPSLPPTRDKCPAWLGSARLDLALLLGALFIPSFLLYYISIFILSNLDYQPWQSDLRPKT